MSISERDLYHGAALTHLISGSGFRSIEKASGVFRHYQINGCRRVLARHSARRSSPWRFTLRKRELSALREDCARCSGVFLCLVCKTEVICLLMGDQIASLVDLESESIQHISVYSRRNSSIEVRGSAGDVKEKIPRHAFPGRLLHLEVDE